MLDIVLNFGISPTVRSKDPTTMPGASCSPAGSMQERSICSRMATAVASPASSLTEAKKHVVAAYILGLAHYPMTTDFGNHIQSGTEEQPSQYATAILSILHVLRLSKVSHD